MKLIAVCLLILSLLAGISSAQKLPLVWIISTGGTIAEKINPETGAAVPAVSGNDLMKAVPGLAKVARIKVFELCNIDSSHMTPEIWRKLALKVNEVITNSEVKGVVVTHGTDTMAEGAFFSGINCCVKKIGCLCRRNEKRIGIKPGWPGKYYERRPASLLRRFRTLGGYGYSKQLC